MPPALEPVRPARPTRRIHRPGPAPVQGRVLATTSTRELIVEAAAKEFSLRGYDGANVDAMAQAAGVTKAMVYYHFESKLALYRSIVGDMLATLGAAVVGIAESQGTPVQKIERFVATVASIRDHRPWFPPLMMREMAAGAPHLDEATLAQMRGVLGAFTAILEAGVRARVFRRVHPMLAYMTILGPMLMNAVRERAAEEPGRTHLPMFVPIDHRDLVAHMQVTALRMLVKEPTR